MKSKTFFILFIGFSVLRNCLRLGSGPLSRIRNALDKNKLNYSIKQTQKRSLQIVYNEAKISLKELLNIDQGISAHCRDIN